MSKRSSKFDLQMIDYLYKLYNTAKPHYGPRNFFYKLNKLIDTCADITKKAALDRPVSRSRRAINKAKLLRMFHREDKFARIGYVTDASAKILVGVLIDKTKKAVFRGMKVRETVPGDADKSVILFKIKNADLSVIGNRNRLVKSINNRFGYAYAREPREICETNPDEKIKELFYIEQKEPQIHIYQTQYNDIETGKKLRVRAYSDDQDILDKFLKSNFDDKGKAREPRQILSLGFSNGKQKTTLKITRLNENQYLLRWKKENALSHQISTLFHLSDENSLLIDASDDEKLLSDLFRNEKVNSYAANSVYNRILSDYSDYVKLNWKNNPELRYQNINERIRICASPSGYKVEPVKLIKRCGFYFPYNSNKAPDYKLLRVSKDNKIVQHVLLNHEELYWSGDEETIKRFFVFSPFIILDFRKNPKYEFESTYRNNYTLSSGEFLHYLKTNPAKLMHLLTEKGRSIIESFNLSTHYKIACELLTEIRTFKLTPQQKGTLFEIVCFIILSKIFLTQRLGNSYSPDGKFLVDEDKVVYDAKNIGPNTSFIKSVERYGRIKDIDYIQQENTNKYIYIATQIADEQFQEVKTRINAVVPSCTVSAITIGALEDLVRLYDADPRRFSTSKFKNKISLGMVIRNLSEGDVLADESRLAA